MLKKLISALLIISLLASFLAVQGFAFNVETYDEADAFYEGKALIDKLGIISSGVDLPSDYVTREMFALYVARMLKIDEMKASTVRYFSDVEYDSFAVNAINGLVETGIISVPESHLFRPGEYISQAEALKMLVCALGYETLASCNGGYPNGYIKTAKALDIYVKCENSNILTGAEAGTMIYNAMRAEISNVSAVTWSDDKNYIVSGESTETFLEMYWNISENEGCVEAVYGGDIIKSDYTLGEDEVIINGTRYNKETGLDLTDYLGNYVRYFYEIKNDSKFHKILVAEKCSMEEDISIDFYDFEKIEGETISYYNKKGKLIEKVLENPIIVYNGSILGANLSAVIKAVNKGKITLKDSNNDKKYDVVIIEDYRGFVISSLNSSALVLYDKVGLTDDIDLKKYENAIFLNSKGEKLAFSDLAVGQVLSVSASKDKKYVKIIHETDSFNGVYKSIKNNKGTVEITIDDKIYELDKTFVKYFNERCVLNTEYMFTKDSFGKIVYAETPVTVYKFGYIIGAYKDDEGFNSATVVKLLTEDNEIKIYECASKLTIDGHKKKSEDISGILGNNDLGRQQLIRYSLSGEKIKNIGTKVLGNESRKTSMVDVFEGNERDSHWYNSLRLGVKAIMNNNTVIFCIPDSLENAEEDDYFLVKSGELKNDVVYVSDAYKNNSESAYADAVVIYYKFSEGWGNDRPANKKLFVVEEISEQIYEDNVVTAIEGYELGTKKIVYDDEEMDFSGIEKGDLLRFNYDRDGTLRKMDNDSGYELVYDWSSKSAPVLDGVHWFNSATLESANADPTTGCLIYDKNVETWEYYRADYQITYGEVLSKKGTVLEWNGTGGNIYADAADLAGLPITVFDEATETVFVGSVDDIIDRESGDKNNSRIFFEQAGGSGRAAVIYNFK